MESKRGRPKCLYKIFGSASLCVIYDGGAAERTARTRADLVYSAEALRALKGACVPHSEEIYSDETGYMCPAILAQLGRMLLSDGYSAEFTARVAAGVCALKRRGVTVKEIERGLREARRTAMWGGEGGAPLPASGPGAPPR